MRQFGLVFGYSFMERVRSRAFTNMTVVMILILAALIILPNFLGKSEKIVNGDIVVLDTVGIVNNTDGFKDNVSDLIIGESFRKPIWPQRRRSWSRRTEFWDCKDCGAEREAAPDFNGP